MSSTTLWTTHTDELESTLSIPLGLFLLVKKWSQEAYSTANPFEENRV